MGNTITKSKSFGEKLLMMRPGEQVLVKHTQFTGPYIRRVVKKLNDQGYSFEATERQVDGGLIVTRLR